MQSRQGCKTACGPVPERRAWSSGGYHVSSFQNRQPFEMLSSSGEDGGQAGARPRIIFFSVLPRSDLLIILPTSCQACLWDKLLKKSAF